MATYLILGILCSALVVGAIVGGLVWSIVTQHRDHGCESLRVRLAFPARSKAHHQPAAIRARVTRETV